MLALKSTRAQTTMQDPITETAWTTALVYRSGLIFAPDNLKMSR